MFRKILVAYDESDGAKAAPRVGIGLAKSLGVELHSISVEEHLPHYAATIDEVQDAKERIDAYFQKLTKEARDYERVNDSETRARLRASWGFCNWHAWLLRDTSDSAFGFAILSEDLLRVLIRRFERSAAHEGARQLPRWRRLLARLGREFG